MAFPFSCPHFIGGGKAGPSSSKTRVQVVHTKWVLGHKSCSYRHSVRVAASHHASAAASTARPVRAAGPTPVVLPRLVCALCSFMVLCFNLKFRPLVATDGCLGSQPALPPLDGSTTFGGSTTTSDNNNSNCPPSQAAAATTTGRVSGGRGGGVGALGGAQCVTVRPRARALPATAPSGSSAVGATASGSLRVPAPRGTGTLAAPHIAGGGCTGGSRRVVPSRGGATAASRLVQVMPASIGGSSGATGCISDRIGSCGM